MTRRKLLGCAILSSETRRRDNPWFVSSRFPPFSQCSSLVDKSAWLASCLDMTCDCLQKGGDSRECKCSALEDYVRQCRRHQPTIHLQDWRSMHLCREYFRFLSTRYLLSQRQNARRVLCTTIASITAANRIAPPSAPVNLPAPRCRFSLFPHPPIFTLCRVESASRGASARVGWSETETPASSRLTAQIVSAGIILNPQRPSPYFFRQKSGLGYSTFDGKNARLKPDKVHSSLF